MPIQSLGFATDAMLRAFAGEIIETPRYTAIKTPSNPIFRWGNLLIYPHAPQAGDLERWQADFVAEFPDTKHRLFGWDDPQGAAGASQAFVEVGYRIDVFDVLTAKAVNPPPKLNTACEIRPLASDSDWQAAIGLSLAVDDAEPAEKREGAGYREYLEKRNLERQAMVAAGWGHWWGAFVDGQLAASLGLFAHNGRFRGIARFQDVATYPQFRRQGLCGTLVYQVSQQALASSDDLTLVMVADPDDVAIGIYQSVGFRRTERQAAAEWVVRGD
jgi:ribosomal protein S18 acetylase RimI-like enzyme